MKKFGEPFKKYEPFEIAHISIPDTTEDYNNLSNLGVEVDKHALNELRPPAHYVLTRGKPVDRIVLTNLSFSDELKKELKKVKVEPAPVANVYQFSPKQPDLSNFIRRKMLYFNYYLVELGLSVLLGREAIIPILRFEADLYSDGEDRTDVTTTSLAPTDRIKKLKIIDGKISIGVNNLLNLIPGPFGKIIPNLIDIDINPIEFKWELRRYEIDVDGPLDYVVSWKIYETETVQSFNPMMIIKAKKKVSKIYAKVRAIYKLKTKPDTPFIPKLFWKAEVFTKDREVSILPQ